MKIKKIILIIAPILIFSMFFGACVSNKIGDTSTNISTKDKEDGNDDTKTSENEPVLKEKLTLKILMHQGFNPEYVPSSDQPVFQELERLTNVHLDIEILPYDDPGERLAAAVAAREQFDMVAIKDEGEPFDTYGMEGYFIPLQSLISEHAPNIKKVFDDPLTGDILPYTQDVWSEMTATDGNIYSLPSITSSNAIGAVFAIREDWLKTLNLEIPETVEELYSVLKAFRKNDPNGNNMEDEIPYSFQTGSYYRALPIINGFGAHISLYLDKTDDTIKFGPIEQSWKEGIAFLNKLHKEQLLDNGFQLGGNNERWSALVSANLLGMTFGWPLSGICGANIELSKIDESYAFVPMQPLKAPDGKRFKDTNTAGRIVVPGLAAITSFNEYPTETMKFLDFLYSEEGTRLTNYGVESLHYNMVDGKPIYTDLIMKHPDGLDPETATSIEGAGLDLPTIFRWDSSFQLMTAFPEVIQTWKLYREPGLVEAPLPRLHFKDDEIERGPDIMAEIQAYIGQGYQDETITTFILGDESIDRFDDFVEQIKRMGLDEALRIYNEAYRRYKSYER